MANVPTQLLQAISQELSRIPADTGDLAIAAAQLSAQLDALSHLDDLDLLTVEPATVLLPPTEEKSGAR